jgi:hypothetical protein
VATLIVNVVAPGPAALMALVLAFVWGCYALFRINYAIFTACLTGYIVFILMLGGVAEMTAATTRALYTIEGGALALFVYAIWPTWAASTRARSLGAMLDAHGAYVGALLGAYADPRRPISTAGSQTRIRRRGSRAPTPRPSSNACSRNREPRGAGAAHSRSAAGALRRHALGALALHAGLERGVHEPVHGMAKLESEMTESLAILAAAVKSGAQPSALPRAADTTRSWRHGRTRW